MKKRLHKRKMFFGVALLAIVALALAIPTFGLSVVVPLAFALAPKIAIGAASFAAASPFLISRICLDAGGDDGNGPSLKEIGDKVERGIDAIRGEQKSFREQFTSDLGNLSKSAKDLLEDITKLKKNANDTQSNHDELLKKIKLLDARIGLEARMAFGNPVQRIQQNEELRWRLNAAVRLAVTASDPDARKAMMRQFPEFITKALGEDASPGSTLINQELANEMYDTLQHYGIWNSFAVRNVGTKTNIFPVKTARAVALAIIAEGTQITDDANKAGTTVTATILDIAVLLNIYFRLLEDAEFDVTADVMDDFMEAFAYRLDWFCTQADGGSDTTDGAMTGIFGGGGTAITAAAGNVTVETTDEADWRNTILGVDAAVLQRPARWWMHPQILVRALAVKDANKRSIFLTGLEAPSAGAIGSILGYPITLGAICPTTNAASAKVAVFGDPNGQVVAVRKGFEVATSDHHKWDYAMRSFRGIGRAATKIRAATAFGVLTLPAQ